MRILLDIVRYENVVHVVILMQLIILWCLSEFLSDVMFGHFVESNSSCFYKATMCGITFMVVGRCNISIFLKAMLQHVYKILNLF